MVTFGDLSLPRYIHFTLILVLAFAAQLFIPGQGPAAEKTYPTKPINIVVPYAPGGANDLSSKTIAERLPEFLGQPVLQVYKPGAGGAIGTAFVAKSKPDGYTLVSAGTSWVIAPLVTNNAGYGIDDLIPICGYAKSPFMFNVKAGGTWKALGEFIADAKKNPGKLKYGTSGASSNLHFVMEYFCKKAGIKLTHIPFSSTPQANAAVMGGHVDIACTTGTGGMYKSGGVKVLAIAEKKRLPGIEEVPTLDELGIPLVIDGHFALLVPKATPADIITTLYEAHKKAFSKYEKEIAATLANLELYPAFTTQEEEKQKFAKDYDVFREIAKDLGILTK